MNGIFKITTNPTAEQPCWDFDLYQHGYTKGGKNGKKLGSSEKSCDLVIMQIYKVFL